jgi:hypothetical protein
MKGEKGTKWKSTPTGLKYAKECTYWPKLLLILQNFVSAIKIVVFDVCSTSHEFLYCEYSVFACLAHVIDRDVYVTSLSEQLTPVRKLLSHWAGCWGDPE